MGIKNTVHLPIHIKHACSNASRTKKNTEDFIVMSVTGIAEQITLDSGETELATITPIKDNLKKVTLEFVQQNKLHKTQRQVRVFDHKTLYVKEMIGKQSRHILFDLSLIDENAVTSRSINKGLFIASIISGILGFAVYHIQSNSLIDLPSLYLYSAFGVLALTSLACFVLTVKSYKNNLVFNTAHGKVPILALFKNIPNKNKFKQFSKALMGNIELARSNNSIPASKLMPAIVGEHRRLFEKGFITEAQFEQAKKNILRN